MFGKKKPEDVTKLDEAVTRLLSQMSEVDPNSEEYEVLLQRLSELNAIRTKDRSVRITPDTALLVAGNLLGILVIVAYEQKHVMASKGLGFVMKAK